MLAGVCSNTAVLLKICFKEGRHQQYVFVISCRTKVAPGFTVHGLSEERLEKRDNLTKHQHIFLMGFWLDD